MAMKDKEAIAMLKLMEDYIEQDASEKAEEIDVMAEEEFHMEKHAYMKPRMQMVKKYFDNLEIKINQQSALNTSKMKNHGFRNILTARNQIIVDLIQSAESRLIQLTDDRNKILYKKMIFQLIVQGLVRMLEPSVIIKVRSKDVQIAKSVLKQAQDYFYSVTGMKITLNVNEKEFLPAKVIGGVFMYSRDESISLENSLQSKLKIVRDSATSYIRTTVFGPNVNRRFRD